MAWIVEIIWVMIWNDQRWEPRISEQKAIQASHEELILNNTPDAKEQGYWEYKSEGFPVNDPGNEDSKWHEVHQEWAEYDIPIS